ncbi:MAG TPA: carboxypeptidase-like regulatory domain-containing protein [Bryobacteraceae bacterium]|nr:carboxypeptidase-like regulatory domain-containing protein [Bryobacteraceae bacterium]
MRSFYFLLLATPLLAQSQLGNIAGSITDPNGDPVPAAPIQLRRIESGKRLDTTSTAKGAYSFSKLPAGTYELLIPAIGFTYAKFERKNLVVKAAEPLRVDVHLEWAGNLGTIGDDDATILRSSRSPVPKGPTPRMPDGKPDFSGMWNGDNDHNPEEPVLLEWAEKIAKQRSEKDNPSTLCLPGDVLLTSPNPFKIIQTSTFIMILAEYNVGAFRQIFLDGRKHPKDLNPTWMGHSIGRWEGDTLVADTVGFNDRSWLDVYPHTEMLHVVTRYRRPDYGHLDVALSIEDPATFTKPWKIHVVWELVPSDEIQEFICENNKDPAHMAGK